MLKLIKNIFKKFFYKIEEIDYIRIWELYFILFYYPINYSFFFSLKILIFKTNLLLLLLLLSLLL